MRGASDQRLFGWPDALRFQDSWNATDEKLKGINLFFDLGLHVLSSR